MLPVLWYGSFSELPGDLVEVQPFFCELGSDSKTTELVAGDAEGIDEDTDSLSLPHSSSASNQPMSVSTPSLPANASTGSEDLGSTLPSTEELSPGADRVQSDKDKDKEGAEEVAVDGVATGTSVSFRALSVPNTPSTSSSSSPSLRGSSLKQFVPRNSLIILDDHILRMHCTHEATSHLSGALLDFAEWENFDITSFVWPDSVEKLMR